MNTAQISLQKQSCQETKTCAACGIKILKTSKCSAKQWGNKKYCSPLCKNRSKPVRQLKDRFLEKIKTAEGGCVEWQASKDGHGYGQMSCHKGASPLKAHRVSYELFVGEIPHGMHVLHKCDNPACVNPEHLFLGTHKDNMEDMVLKNRQQRISRPGEESHQALLTWSEVNEIRALYLTGKLTYKDLSCKYPVKPCTLMKIVRNKLWIDKNYKYQKTGNKKPRPSRRAQIPIEEIIRLRNDGLSFRKIGCLYGVCKGTIISRINGGLK